MADFKTHVTFSSVIGAGYAVVGSGMGFDLSTALVAGGLCGVSGMLPDVDSDSGIPRRETLGFAAAIVPVLLIDRFKQFNLSHDQMVMVGVSIYFGIRYIAANLIGRWSVHRGMWHSIPAVLIFAGLAFLIGGSTDIFVRYFKAVAVGLGAMSHLVLDEVYSVDTRGVMPRFKKSFGTAIKFWGKKPWANFSVYAKLAIVAGAIMMDAGFLERVELRNPELADKFRGVSDRFQGAKDRLAQLPAAERMAAPASRPAPPDQRDPSFQQNGTPHGLRSPMFAPIRLPTQGGAGGFVPNRGGPPPQGYSR